MKVQRLNKFYSLLLVAALGAPAPQAFATLATACARQTSTEMGECRKNQQTGQDETPGCTQTCRDAKSACETAQRECQGAATQDSALQRQGAQASETAANNAGERQAQQEGANANNMCSGQRAQQARESAGRAPLAALERCISKAQECENKGGPSAQTARRGAEQAKAAVTAENSSRAREASSMANSCKQSNKNEDKLGQMPQMPQMPEKKGEGKGESAVTNSDMDKGATATAAEITTSKLGNPDLASKSGETSSSPATDGSSLSSTAGNGASFGSGASHSPPEFQAGHGSGASGHPSGASVGSSGASSPGSSSFRNPEGIAAMNVKPESNAFEIQPGGGKSMLGLRGGKGGEDFEPNAAAVAGAPGKEEAPAEEEAEKREPANASNGAQSADSLFRMVKARYVQLRRLGHI